MTSKFVFMPRFERSIRQLKKRFRHVADDVETTLKTIEENPRAGAVIPNDYSIYKLRVASRDMQRGKSGGFRLLYKLSADDSENQIVYLLFIYAKSDRENVTFEQLQTMIEDVPPANKAE